MQTNATPPVLSSEANAIRWTSPLGAGRVGGKRRAPSTRLASSRPWPPARPEVTIGNARYRAVRPPAAIPENPVMSPIAFRAWRSDPANLAVGCNNLDNTLLDCTGQMNALYAGREV